MSTIAYTFSPNDTVWCILPSIPSLVSGIVYEVHINSYTNIDMDVTTTKKYKVFLTTTNEYITLGENYVYASQMTGLTALAALIDDQACL